MSFEDLDSDALVDGDEDTLIDYNAQCRYTRNGYVVVRFDESGLAHEVVS